MIRHNLLAPGAENNLLYIDGLCEPGCVTPVGCTAQIGKGGDDHRLFRMVFYDNGALRELN